MPRIDKLKNNFYNTLKNGDLIRINIIEGYIELY